MVVAWAVRRRRRAEHALPRRRPPRPQGAPRSRPGAGDCSSTRTMSAPPLTARGAPRRSRSGSSSPLRRDVMCPAVRPEGSRETGIAGDLRRARRCRSRSIDGREAAVVAHRGDHHDDRHEEPEGVDAAEGRASRDRLPGLVSPLGEVTVDAPGRSGHRRRRPRPPHPGRLPPTEAAAIADLRPGAIPRPPQVGAVHGVPLRVARRERATDSPLPPRRRSR